MKKILFLFTLYFLSSISVLAIDDVVLETEKPSFAEYLGRVYNGEEEYETASPVLKLFSKRGYEFENSFVNSVKFSFLYDQRLNFNYPEGGNSYLQHKFATAEPMITVKFNENRTEAMFDINLLREIPNYDKNFLEKISRAYISHKINDNQLIVLGQGVRLPSTYNGSRATMQQEFVLKSQLGRTFGDTESAGIRNMAQYKYLDYDIGFYDSTRYMQNFGRGTDFTGQIVLKPLENIKDKSGSLQIAGGYNIGKYNFSYQQYSVYTAYDYKRFHLKAEYANADGYNGIKDSRNDADGLYTTLSIDILPKLTLLGRYDTFDYNKHINNSNTEEYTVGLLYRPYKNMKFILNYVFKHPANQRNSNMILFATRFFI